LLDCLSWTRVEVNGGPCGRRSSVEGTSPGAGDASWKLLT